MRSPTTSRRLGALPFLVAELGPLAPDRLPALGPFSESERCAAAGRTETCWMTAWRSGPLGLGLKTFYSVTDTESRGHIEVTGIEEEDYLWPYSVLQSWSNGGDKIIDFYITSLPQDTEPFTAH